MRGEIRNFKGRLKDKISYEVTGEVGGVNETVTLARVVSSLTFSFPASRCHEITCTPSHMFTCALSQGHVCTIAGPRACEGEEEETWRKWEKEKK